MQYRPTDNERYLEIHAKQNPWEVGAARAYADAEFDRGRISWVAAVERGWRTMAADEVAGRPCPYPVKAVFLAKLPKLRKGRK